MKTVKKRIALMVFLAATTCILFGDAYDAQTLTEKVGFYFLVAAFGASIGYGAGLIKWGFNQ